MVVAIKRAYERPTPADGTRILVDRLWPRGLSKAKAALDEWAKDIAPSPVLRIWFGHRPERFSEFRKRYLKELSSNPAWNAFRTTFGRKKITLVYGAKDPKINHAVVLASILNRKRRARPAVRRL
ncbi:MAG TPA: DUF488 family protein [Rhizomicrobium sp.]|jgi:uncharacterized protein YeaO (DUF488 family)